MDYEKKCKLLRKKIDGLQKAYDRELISFYLWDIATSEVYNELNETLTEWYNSVKKRIEVIEI